MRVGVISDIHADVGGLRLALTLLRDQGVDKIICAGDLVDKGPNGDGVITLIREQAIPCVYGNHDHDAVGNQVWLRENLAPERKHHLLTDESLDFLAQLPGRMLIPTQVRPILLAHGTPWSDMMYVFPTSKRNTFKAVAREAWDEKAGAVILGHTHIPMIAYINDVWILNPGSVCGAYSSGSQTCAILSLPDYTFAVFDIITGRRIQIEYTTVANMRE